MRERPGRPLSLSIGGGAAAGETSSSASTKYRTSTTTSIEAHVGFFFDIESDADRLQKR